MEHLQRTAALSTSLGLGSTIQGQVRLLLSFHSHTFNEKNYLKFSLQFPAGHMYDFE
jgi:hypothetical protein